MKLYAIFGDNGESWEDAWYGIMEEHIYLHPKDAEEACFKLNHPIIVQPTKQELEECGWECTWETFVEIWNKEKGNGDWKFTVKELTAK